jgi:hypothetical protein
VIEELWLLRGLEGVVLLVGGLIAFAALRAFRRTHQSSLAYLGAGFAVVTVGAATAGIVYELVTHDLLVAWIVSTFLDAVGFALILASILGPFAPAVEFPSGASLETESSSPEGSPPPTS